MRRIGNRSGRLVGFKPQACATMLTRSLSRFCRRLSGDTRGVTTIEFALVSLPFFALILGTFSIGLYYLYTTSLDLAVYATARQFMTGQVQSGSTSIASGAPTPAQFTTLLCSNMPAFVPCSGSNPVISVNVVNNFGSLTTNTTRTDNSVNPPRNYTAMTLNHLPSFVCSPAPLDIVYIQAVYKLPIFNAYYSIFGGTVVSGTSFQVEEFPVNGGVSTNC